MPSESISYKDSGYFTPLVNDYLDQKEHLKPLYNRFPTLENFKAQILDKQAEFTDQKREVLVSVLKKQYLKLSTSNLTTENIAALKENKTFTVTTGHQLNLFTGPLYFLYKIISTINLTKDLKTKYPEYNFVPIYWMATEDHDFEEINYFNFKGKKFRWNKDSKGPVGRLSTEGLKDFYDIFSLELGTSQNAEYIKHLFKTAYLEHDLLADATRYLANALFGEFGLVIIDGDNAHLKQEFIPYIKDELLNQTSYKKVTQTIRELSRYPVQVNPREVNLFYITDQLRERIIFIQGIYKINNTTLEFTENEILLHLELHPENFSPNVITRPLYQEVILPNLCYIGGGGEISYWLELKSYFDALQITFPILLLRNSALLITKKQIEKVAKLNLSTIDLFKKQSDLLNEKVKTLSDFPRDLSAQKEALRIQFDYLKKIALQTDPSFTGAVNAQEAKQIKGLVHLEKRLQKAQKRKYKDLLKRTVDLQNELFPTNSLQERQSNFSEFFIPQGTTLIEQLLKELKPLEPDFAVVEL